MSELEVRQRFNADPQTVWNSVTDHESMPQWSPLKQVTLRVEGAPERNGIGAVRVMKGPGPVIEEEVVAWDPPRSYGYKLVRGAPLRNHAGRVTLDSSGSGTEVTWSVRFDPIIPGTGWLFATVLRAALGKMLERLARQLDAAA